MKKDITQNRKRNAEKGSALMSVIIVGGFALAGIAAFTRIMKTSSYHSQALSAKSGFQRLEEKLRSSIKDPAVLRTSMDISNSNNLEFKQCIGLLAQDPDPKEPNKALLPVSANCLAGVGRKAIHIRNTLGENIAARYDPSLGGQSSSVKYSPDAEVCDGQLIANLVSGNKTPSQKRKLPATNGMCRFSSETDYEFRCYEEDYRDVNGDGIKDATCTKPTVVRVHYWLKDNPPLKAGTKQLLYKPLTDALPELPGKVRAKIGFVDVAVREIVNGGIMCGPNQTLKKIGADGMPVCNPAVVGSSKLATTGGAVQKFGSAPITLLTNSVRVEDNQQVLVAMNYRLPCSYIYDRQGISGQVDPVTCRIGPQLRPETHLDGTNVAPQPCGVNNDGKPLFCNFRTKTPDRQYIKWQKNRGHGYGDVKLFRNGAEIANLGNAALGNGSDVMTGILYDNPPAGEHIYSIQFNTEINSANSTKELFVKDLSLNLLALPKE